VRPGQSDPALSPSRAITTKSSIYAVQQQVLSDTQLEEIVAWIHISYNAAHA
jgi:hypothetical protein